MIWSIPGATNPVQLATTRWVISPGVPRASIARMARSGAAMAYNAIRSPVPGSGEPA